MATGTDSPPPPPPGFTLDAAEGAPPPPPPGFTLDAAPAPLAAPKKPATAAAPPPKSRGGFPGVGGVAMTDDPETRPSLPGGKDLLGAAVEPGLALATGAAAAPISGLAGLASMISQGMGLTKEAPGDTVRRVGSAMTYRPRSKGGADALEVMSSPFEALADVADAGGARVADVSGSPALGAYANTTVQGLAQILMGGVGKKGAPIPGVAKDPKAAAANAEGFSMTPNDAGGGLFTRAAAGLAGEPKLARGVSDKNQPVLMEKVAKDVGLPPGSEVTLESLNRVRSQAGKAYETARNMGRVDMDGTFYSDMQRIAGDFAKAEIDFPGGKSPVMDIVENLRVNNADAGSVVSKINTLRKEANRYFKGGDAEAGFAAKEAASALEDQLIRHGQKIGYPPDLVQNMIDARTQIAKTYAAQKALKGDQIDPQVYARELAKGRKLTGEAQTIAEFGRDFPRSAQSPARGGGHAGMGVPTVVDAGLGMLHGGGLKELLLTLGARPGARTLLSSPPVQRMMIRPPNVGHAASRLYAPGAFQQGQLPPPP